MQEPEAAKRILARGYWAVATQVRLCEVTNPGGVDFRGYRANLRGDGVTLRWRDFVFLAARLGAALKAPHALAGARHIYNQYVIRAQERDGLRAHLTAAGVGTEIYYPVPLHLQQCFAYLGCKPGDCPQSERAAAETLALPIYPELTEAQLQYVVDTIAAYYRV